MKLKISLTITVFLTLTSGYSKTPEQWICVNARNVSGLSSLEVMAKTSIGDEAWRSIDVYLVRDKSQDIEAIETYGYPPARTSVTTNAGAVTVDGKNREVFGKVMASITVDLTRAKRGLITSHLLDLAGSPIRGSTTVYEGSLMLKTGSSADSREIPMDCASAPAN